MSDNEIFFNIHGVVGCVAFVDGFSHDAKSFILSGTGGVGRNFDGEHDLGGLIGAEFAGSARINGGPIYDGTVLLIIDRFVIFVYVKRTLFDSVGEGLFVAVRVDHFERPMISIARVQYDTLVHGRYSKAEILVAVRPSCWCD